MVASIALLGLAMKTLRLRTAYAVWTGIGTVGAVIPGIAPLGDSVAPMGLVWLGFIVVGIAGAQAVGLMRSTSCAACS